MMIKAVFFTVASGDLVGFRITGHSGYADSGSDIVCAAVSSAAYLTANTVTEVLNISAEVEAEDGNMLFRIFSKDAMACRDFFAGLKLHLLSLEEQYPDYIQVNYTEV